MLAYYVEWHMREAWRELTFAAEDSLTRLRVRCGCAQGADSYARGWHADAWPEYFAELGAIVRNTCRMSNTGPVPTSFQITTTANPEQRRALELIRKRSCSQNAALQIHAICLNLEQNLRAYGENFRLKCEPI